jgi:hypothetical protein
VPASAIERDRQVHCGGCCGHDLQTLVCRVSQILCNPYRYCRVNNGLAAGAAGTGRRGHLEWEGCQLER